MVFMARMSRSLVAALASAESEPICASNSESLCCSSALKRISVPRVPCGFLFAPEAFRSFQPSARARLTSAWRLTPASAASAVRLSIPFS